ncbi:MAG: galactokinase, partial [Bacteroidetes bacterium]|nr:galactokinase [Bacteroidota bacterium]
RLRSLNFDEEVVLRLGKLPETPPAHWATYVGGVLCELHRRGEVTSGMELLLFGDVPLGAGLSSSAALTVAVAVAVETLTGSPRDPVETARLCRHVEHTYVGVQCGIMDPFVARLGRAGHALFLDCRSLDYRHIPLPLDQASIVLVDSGVKRQLAGSKYNERRAECAEAVAHFQQHDPSIQALRDVTPALFAQGRAGLPERIQRRAQHVIEENARVLEAVRCLEAGDLQGFGMCMNRSHASLRDLYEVSCLELDFLAETAQQTPGVLGARMTGGGFGGCTVNLVEKLAAEGFWLDMVEVYEKRFECEATVYLVEENVEAGAITPASL